LRIIRLMLYVLIAVMLWSYFTGASNVSSDFNKFISLGTATVAKVKRFVYLSEAVQTRVAAQSGQYVPLEEIPLSLQQALIATEDARFYRHHGVDFEGIARALLINLQDRQFSEGGSTITQQLVKNLFLSQEKTIGRKIEEVILAIGVEMRFSKEEILEMYFNQIYWGSDAAGIGEAANTYFGKKVKNLNLAESAMLAGLPQAPSLYSPYINLQAAKQRQSAVLDLMAKQGFISPGSAEKTKHEPLRLAR
jgi:membrane peptidoglycan carboxypeptidase